MTDRERYVHGDPSLHPGTGRTEHYQDVNGAAVQETQHDAHGNQFTTVHPLNSATRYGYAVYGGAAQPPHHRPRAAWSQAPADATGSDEVTRVGQLDGSSASDNPVETMFLLVLLLLLAGLPLGIAYLVHWSAARRGRNLRHLAVFCALFEPASLLFLWSWLADASWWLPALALPHGK